MHRTLLSLAALLTPVIAAAVPLSVTHQGRVLDATGAPISGSHSLTFSLYGAPTAGVATWSQTDTLALDGGYYHTVFSGVDASILASPPLFLGISLDGAAELSPRTALASVPFALRADTATQLSGGPVDATQITVGGVATVDTAGQITPGAPTTCDGSHQGALSYDTTDASLRICHGTTWMAVWTPVALGASASNPGTSCSSIKALHPSATDGTYWLDPQHDGGAYEVQCDMTTSGGGWTFIANLSDAGTDVWSQLMPAQDTGLWQSTATLGTVSHTADYKSQAYMDLTVTDLLITQDAAQNVLQADACWPAQSFQAFMAGLTWSGIGSDTNWADASGAHRCTYTHFGYSDPVLRATGSTELGFKWGEVDGAQDSNKDRVMITTANANGQAHNVDAPTGLGGFTAYNASQNPEDANECQGDGPNVCANTTQNYGLWVR